MAFACGYASSLDTDDSAQIAVWLKEPPIEGARFARLAIRAGAPSDLPRPSMTPVEVKSRLMLHIGARPGVS
jgi:phosphonopyruvate decarboxylase